MQLASFKNARTGFVISINPALVRYVTEAGANKSAIILDNAEQIEVVGSVGETTVALSNALNNTNNL